MNLIMPGRTGTLAEPKLPILAHYKTDLSPEDWNQIAALARRILEREDTELAKVPPLAPQLAVGYAADLPTLLLEDHSGIQLAHEGGADTALSYRALLLAGEGDLVTVYGRRDIAYETYCRDMLGLGRVEVFAPPVASTEQTLWQACIADRHFIARVVDVARDAGGLNLLPYMAIGGIWRLAGDIAGKAKVPVHIAGPPPRLARAVNDKLWFAQHAARLLGGEAVPPSRTVHGMAALAGHVRRFMRLHGRVALKLSHSAASLGNLVLDSRGLAELSPAGIAAQLGALMEERGWHNPFPLQMMAWEAPLLGSPSAQIWIPLPGEGAPVVEGIFDQIVSGSSARFAGAVPSRLPEHWRQRIAEDAARLGAFFQQLGYFGRCSFDAVLIEHGDAENRLHWVECNGRWGGVSIPMTLASRLLGDWTRAGMAILDQQRAAQSTVSTEEFVDRFYGVLFKAGSRSEGAILLSPGRIAQGSAELLMLGRDDHDALARGEALLTELGD